MSDLHRFQGDQGDLGDFFFALAGAEMFFEVGASPSEDWRCSTVSQSMRNSGSRNGPPHPLHHRHSDSPSQLDAEVPLVPLVPLWRDRIPGTTSGRHAPHTAPNDATRIHQQRVEGPR